MNDGKTCNHCGALRRNCCCAPDDWGRRREQRKAALWPAITLALMLGGCATLERHSPADRIAEASAALQAQQHTCDELRGIAANPPQRDRDLVLFLSGVTVATWAHMGAPAVVPLAVAVVADQDLKQQEQAHAAAVRNVMAAQRCSQ